MFGSKAELAENFLDGCGSLVYFPVRFLFESHPKGGTCFGESQIV